MILTGTFYRINAKDEALKAIDDILATYDRPYVSCTRRDAALLEQYCYETIKFLDSNFANDMHSIKSCKSHIREICSKENIVFVPFGYQDVSETLRELRLVVENSINFSDLPSCKHLLDLSVEDAVSLANDLTSGGSSNASFDIVLLGKKVGEAITIADVRSFYDKLIEQLQLEIESNEGVPSVTEEFLMAKFKCELAYCHKAIVKTGIGVFKEVYDLVTHADEDIGAFEEMESGLTKG